MRKRKRERKKGRANISPAQQILLKTFNKFCGKKKKGEEEIRKEAWRERRERGNKKGIKARRKRKGGERGRSRGGKERERERERERRKENKPQ